MRPTPPTHTTTTITTTTRIPRQVTAAMRLADGMMLCVDAAEGLMVVAERAVRQALQEGLAITLVITKVRYGTVSQPCAATHSRAS